MATAFSVGLRSSVLAPVNHPSQTLTQPQKSQGSQASRVFISSALAGICGMANGQSPASRRKHCMKAGFDPRYEIGSMKHLGGYFDPLNFMRKTNLRIAGGEEVETWQDEDRFRQFRTAELKHGRVAMLAALGLLVQPYVRFPDLKDAQNDWSALDSGAGGAFGVLFLCAGWMELIFWKQDPANAVGDFSKLTEELIRPFPPLGAPASDDDKRSLKEKELNNGRLAMSAVITNLTLTATTGLSTVDQVDYFVKPAQAASPVLVPLAALLLINAWKDKEERNYEPPASPSRAPPPKLTA